MKKKLLFSIMSFIFITFGFILCSNEVEATYYNDEISYDKDGTEITVYATSTDITSATIPSSIDGYSVTEIKIDGFKNCTN